MMLPAPGLFSTVNGWPSRSDIFCATTRPMRSLPPPGAKPITTFTGCLGQSGAWARAVAWASARAVAAAVARTIARRVGRLGRVMLAPPSGSDIGAPMFPPMMAFFPWASLHLPQHAFVFPLWRKRQRGSSLCRSAASSNAAPRFAALLQAATRLLALPLCCKQQRGSSLCRSAASSNAAGLAGRGPEGLRLLRSSVATGDEKGAGRQSLALYRNSDAALAAPLHTTRVGPLFRPRGQQSPHHH